jgi:hypothetical protein
MFQSRWHYTTNDLEQVINTCLSRITLKSFSGGTLRQFGFLSIATAENSWRENIGLSKLSPDSTLHRKVTESRTIISFFLSFNEKSQRLVEWRARKRHCIKTSDYCMGRSQRIWNSSLKNKYSDKILVKIRRRKDWSFNRIRYYTL